MSTRFISTDCHCALPLTNSLQESKAVVPFSCFNIIVVRKWWVLHQLNTHYHRNTLFRYLKITMSTWSYLKTTRLFHLFKQIEMRNYVFWRTCNNLSTFFTLLYWLKCCRVQVLIARFPKLTWIPIIMFIKHTFTHINDHIIHMAQSNT